MAVLRLAVSSKSKLALLGIGIMEYTLQKYDMPYKIKICDIDINDLGEDAAFSVIKHILEYLPTHDDIVYDVEKID
jgi:hypothetical protein